MTNKPKRIQKLLSLYPLKFEEVVSDVLKVKPESKKKLRKTKPQVRQSKKSA